MRKSISLASMGILLAGAAEAARQPRQARPTVSLSSTVTTRAMPDRPTYGVSLESKAATKADANAARANLTKAVKDALKAATVEAGGKSIKLQGKVKVTDGSSWGEYETQERRNGPKFWVSNGSLQVEVRTSNPLVLGLVESTVGAINGATTSGPRKVMSDAKKARLQDKTELRAAARGQKRAEAMAKALGFSGAQLVTGSVDSSGGWTPWRGGFELAAARNMTAEAAPREVELDRQQISASFSGTYKFVK